MKEFEKWHSDYGCNLSIDCGDISCNTTCKEVRKETWRAALEWALKAGKNGNCGMCYTESMIEEELEDEN